MLMFFACHLTFAGSRIVGFTWYTFLFSLSFAGLESADTRKSAHMAVAGLLASVDKSFSLENHFLRLRQFAGARL